MMMMMMMKKKTRERGRGSNERREGGREGVDGGKANMFSVSLSDTLGPGGSAASLFVIAVVQLGFK